MTRTEFENLVEAALKKLPRPFREKLANSTAMMPVRKMPSNVPAPPIEATGAPSPRTTSRLSRSAPTSVPRLPPT